MDWYDLTLATYPFEDIEPFPLTGIRCIRLEEEPIQPPTPDTLSMHSTPRLPRYQFFNPFQLPPAQPILLWDSTLISDNDEFDEGTLQGHVQIRVFPRNMHREWARNNTNVPPSYGILRPYGEILEVMRFARDLTRYLGTLQEAHDWDHETFALTYIYTLDCLLPVPRFLWQIYLVAADLSPVRLTDFSSTSISSNPSSST